MRQRYEVGELDQIGTLLSFARCFGAQRRNVTYISTPITTGRHYLQWRASIDLQHKDSELERLEKQHVMDRNLEAARQVVKAMRGEFEDLVLDPTKLVVPQWNKRHHQHLYHELWASFIEAYAVRVVFVDGWEYSTGCSIEFVAAYRNGIPTFTQDLEPLGAPSSIALLEEAIRDFEEAELPSDALRQSVDEIRRLSSGDERSAVCK